MGASIRHCTVHVSHGKPMWTLWTGPHPALSLFSRSPGMCNAIHSVYRETQCILDNPNIIPNSTHRCSCSPLYLRDTALYNLDQTNLSVFVATSFSSCASSVVSLIHRQKGAISRSWVSLKSSTWVSADHSQDCVGFGPIGAITSPSTGFRSGVVRCMIGHDLE